MRRLTGAVLILAASFLLRQSLLASAARRKRTLRSLAHALTAIEYSVRLTLAPLPVLLREAHVSGEVRRLFDRVAAALACGEPLESAWRDAVRELPLSAREREMAASLGSALGGEEESVCTALAQASRTLAGMERALAEEDRQRAQITTAVCLGGGALLSILLL